MTKNTRAKGIRWASARMDQWPHSLCHGFSFLSTLRVDPVLSIRVLEELCIHSDIGKVCMDAARFSLPSSFRQTFCVSVRVWPLPAVVEDFLPDSWMLKEANFLLTRVCVWMRVSLCVCVCLCVHVNVQWITSSIAGWKVSRPWSTFVFAAYLLHKWRLKDSSPTGKLTWFVSFPASFIGVCPETTQTLTLALALVSFVASRHWLLAYCIRIPCCTLWSWITWSHSFPFNCNECYLFLLVFPTLLLCP